MLPPDVNAPIGNPLPPFTTAAHISWRLYTSTPTASVSVFRFSQTRPVIERIDRKRGRFNSWKLYYLPNVLP